MTFAGSLEDQAAIRNLIDRYSDAVFRRDSVAWSACWAEDSLWVLMGTEVKGRSAIVALWEQAMSGFVFVAFFAQPGSIVIVGNRATGRIYTHEVLEDANGAITRPVGRYDDLYVREDGEWRFAERRYNMLKGLAS